VSAFGCGGRWNDAIWYRFGVSKNASLVVIGEQCCTVLVCQRFLFMVMGVIEIDDVGIPTVERKRRNKLICYHLGVSLVSTFWLWTIGMVQSMAQFWQKCLEV
jgi:hypothetical protein